MKYVHGAKFKAKIEDEVVTGKICIENECIYLCQDKKKGDPCSNKLGYKYSWNIDSGSAANLSFSSVEFLNTETPRIISDLTTDPIWAMVSDDHDFSPSFLGLVVLIVPSKEVFIADDPEEYLKGRDYGITYYKYIRPITEDDEKIHGFKSSYGCDVWIETDQNESVSLPDVPMKAHDLPDPSARVVAVSDPFVTPQQKSNIITPLI